MQPIECAGDWLVDYADGELSGNDLAAANEHLQTCAECRDEAAQLQSSRKALDGYFQLLHETVGPASSLPVSVKGSRRWRHIAAVAATIALIVASYALLSSINRDANQPEVARSETPLSEPTAGTEPASADNNTADDDLLAEITRETQIARLRATIAILGQEPGMDERRAALEKYLAEAYQVDIPSM